MRWRHCPGFLMKLLIDVKKVTFVLGILFFAILIQLIFSSFGRFMPEVHGDWASHATVTKFISDGFDLESQGISSVLNEFVKYPKLTYLLAAYLSATFSIHPIYALTIIVQAALIVAALFYALRVVALCPRAPNSAVVLFLILGVMSVVFLRFGWRDLLISNSFLSQLLSIALAQIVIYVALFVRNRFIFLVWAAVCSGVLVNSHIVGFAWAVGTLAIMALGMPRQSFWSCMALFLAICAVAGVFFFSSPGAVQMAKIAGTGGDLRVFNFVNASDHPVFVWMVVVLYIGVLFALFSVRERSLFFIRDTIWRHAGLIVIGPLVAASAMTVFLKGGNWYPVAKWLYVFFPEFSLAIIAYCATRWPSRKVNSCRFYGFLLLVFMAQIPFSAGKVDLQIAALANDGLDVQSNSNILHGDRVYPALRVQHPALNYYISRSVLLTPLDLTTIGWMNGAAGDWRVLGPEDFRSIPPVIEKGKKIFFRSGNDLPLRMLDARWWGLEETHVWASQSPAKIVFVSSSDLRRISIAAVPYVSSGFSERVYKVSVNGFNVGEFELSATGFAAPGVVEFDVPAEYLKENGRVVLEIRWDMISDNDLGIAVVSIEYN